MAKLSYEALNDVLTSSANSGQRISDKTLGELSRFAEKELIDVQRLHDDLIQRADEDIPSSLHRGYRRRCAA